MTSMHDSRCDAIQAAWEQARQKFVPLPPVLPDNERPYVINALIEELTAMYASAFGEQAAAERFVIPQDYLCFLSISQSCWRQGDAYGLYLHDVDLILSNTRFYFELAPENRPATAGMWIEIGHYSDKHDLFLCCDRHLPQFGMVFDGHDDDPWNPEGWMNYCFMKGYQDTSASTSFLDYLQSLA